MTIPTLRKTLRPKKTLPQTSNVLFSPCRYKSAEESAGPATNAAGRRSGAIAYNPTPIALSTVMVRPFRFPWSFSCLSPCFSPYILLTGRRMFVRPTLKPPSQSCPAVCRRLRSPHAKGRVPSPNGTPGCQSRRLESGCENPGAPLNKPEVAQAAG